MELRTGSGSSGVRCPRTWTSNIRSIHSTASRKPPHAERIKGSMDIDGGNARWRSRPAPATHDDPRVSVQAAGGFLENDRGELRTKFVRRDLFESQPHVERHVPRDGPKRRQSDLGTSSVRSPLA